MIKTGLKIFLAILLALLLLGWITCPHPEEELYSSNSEEVINLPLEQSWEKLQNLTLAHHYIPTLIDTKITSEQKTGVGTSRRVYQSPKKYLNETVSEWNEGRGFTLLLHEDNGKAPFPFSQATFTYQISDAGNEQTRLQTSLKYEMGGGCLGHWFHHWVIQRLMDRNAGTIAGSLKHYYETGESLQP